MKCPGQDTRYWNADAITESPCPQCGQNIEFYKDDTSRKCDGCGKRVVNPSMDFGCASYCQFAEECLGTLPEDFKGVGDDLLKDRVAVEVKRYLHTDFTSIQQTITRARFAEAIGKEEGANLAIVLCATYLRDIPREEAETILKKVNASPSLVKGIFDLLSGDGSGTEQAGVCSPAILSDAVELAQLQKRLKANELTHDDISSRGTSLQTEAGRKLAASL